MDCVAASEWNSKHWVILCSRNSVFYKAAVQSIRVYNIFDWCGYRIRLVYVPVYFEYEKYARSVLDLYEMRVPGTENTLDGARCLCLYAHFIRLGMGHCVAFQLSSIHIYDGHARSTVSMLADSGSRANFHCVNERLFHYAAIVAIVPLLWWCFICRTQNWWQDTHTHTFTYIQPISTLKIFRIIRLLAYTERT